MAFFQFFKFKPILSQLILPINFALLLRAMRQLVVVVGHLMHFFVQKIHQEKMGKVTFYFDW
jgi:hypothetical protein